MASKDKYIIKNCPCYVQYENSLHLCCDGQGDGECQGCTNCIMKQIVELCKDELGRVRTIGKDILAEEILKLLDIQEVE